MQDQTLFPRTESLSFSLLLVPINDNIPGRSPTCDDVQLAVLVEISNFQILTGDLVINKVCGPFVPLLARGIESVSYTHLTLPTTPYV